MHVVDALRRGTKHLERITAADEDVSSFKAQPNVRDLKNSFNLPRRFDEGSGFRVESWLVATIPAPCENGLETDLELFPTVVRKSKQRIRVALARRQTTPLAARVGNRRSRQRPGYVTPHCV